VTTGERQGGLNNVLGCVVVGWFRVTPGGTHTHTKGGGACNVRQQRGASGVWAAPVMPPLRLAEGPEHIKAPQSCTLHLFPVPSPFAKVASLSGVGIMMLQTRSPAVAAPISARTAAPSRTCRLVCNAAAKDGDQSRRWELFAWLGREVASSTSSDSQRL
jgi:hypothetical protein